MVQARGRAYAVVPVVVSLVTVDLAFAGVARHPARLELRVAG
jgi:hypothetical protein